MAKQQRVPETKSTEVKPNREQRRHPDGTDHAEDQNLSRDTGPKPELQEQEVGSARTKTTAHGKKTADKWNQ